jgi:predicted transcriptional regulator
LKVIASARTPVPARPPLAKSELEVARIVWRLGAATVRQVLEALPADRGLDFKTVQTYLRRLEAKGYLRTRRAGRAKVYVPRVRPQQVVREVIDDLLERLFGGDSLPLFQHLIQDRGLSDAEIDQLRAMLDELEERR